MKWALMVHNPSSLQAQAWNPTHPRKTINVLDERAEETERDMEDEDGGQNTESDRNKNKKKTVIKIPSFQEVLESSQSKSTPPSLFTPSHSFSQAFAFVKSSEFYSPPPPSTAASQPPQASDATNSRYPFHQFQCRPLCLFSGELLFGFMVVSDWGNVGYCLFWWEIVYSEVTVILALLFWWACEKK